jgi:hypothetical protein
MKGLRYENAWVRNGALFTGFLILNYVDFRLGNTPQSEPFMYGVAILAIVYGLMWLHNIFLLQRYFLKQRFTRYVFGLMGYLLVTAIIEALVERMFKGDTELDLWRMIADYWMSDLMLVFVGSGFFFVHLWLLANVVDTKRRLLQSQTELAYLKQQMNPHFLLNALNNLYGVALTTPSEVPDKIIELSDLLTYQIETSKKDWTSLTEEIAFIDRYLLYIQWKTHGIRIRQQIYGTASVLQITPMVFLPLVENAAKYAPTALDPFFEVQWDIHQNQLEFTVVNSFRPGHSPHSSTQTGLDNLRKRLMLYHPAHELITKVDGIYFTAKLKIWNLSTTA